MKTGIITFHRSINFGAILQAYALKKTLEKMGATVSIINYKTEFIGKNIKIERFLTKLHSAGNPLKMIQVFVYGYYIKKKKRKFLEFASENLSLTQLFSSSNIEESNNLFDIFITGSDQVWNDSCTGFDKSYFLSFVKENRKKNSYSASFGFDRIPAEHYEEYRKLLSSFNNISVREKTGSQIIKDLLNRNVEVTLDPTLLPETEDWLKISARDLNLKEYILVYEMAHSDSLIDFVSSLGRETGLKIIFINNKLEKKIKSATNVRGAGPKEFINLFSNARYVVTNSFHGICFSISFKKTFFAQLLPPPSKVNSRIINILDMLNLKNRLTENFSDISKITEIDYSEVDKILALERERSLNYLKKILSKGQSE